MKKISIDWTSQRDGGWREALNFAGAEATCFQNPPAGGTLLVADASSQVPNLRGPELFAALWNAYRFSSAVIATDTMLSGCIGTYSGYWGPSEPDDRKVSEWENFFSRMNKPLRCISLAPMSLLTFADGDIPSQRMRWIARVAECLNGHDGFDTASILSRIRIVEILEQIEHKGITVGEVIPMIPEFKAVGTWTCPCCAERFSLRHNGMRFIVTDARSSEKSASCFGSRAVEAQVTEDMSLAFLARVTGIELNFFASAGLNSLIVGDTVSMLIRDYSNPRGSIEECLRRYGHRTHLTTRFYLQDTFLDADMTAEKLLSVARTHPAELVSLMRRFPVISDGSRLVMNA